MPTTVEQVDVGNKWPDTPPREKPKKSDAKPKTYVGKGNSQLYKALLQAQKDVKDVEKDATTEFPYKYDYVSAEAILQEARRVLLKNGLLALRPIWSLDIGGPPEADCLIIRFRCEIRHPESGEVKTDEVIFPAIKGKGRPWDKAIAAALTSGWAYWLRDQLQIPRVHASMDNRDDSQFDPRQAIGAVPIVHGREPYSRGGAVITPTLTEDLKPLNVAGTPRPRKAKPDDGEPLPEVDRSRAMAGKGKSLGKVSDDYWTLKREMEPLVEGTAKEDKRYLMKALMPHKDARYRRGDLGWEWYLPPDKAEVAEVSVGSMFRAHDLPESEIAF